MRRENRRPEERKYQEWKTGNALMSWAIVGKFENYTSHDGKDKAVIIFGNHPIKVWVCLNH